MSEVRAGTRMVLRRGMTMNSTDKIDPNRINTTSLAFIGDAVYSVYIRRHVVMSGTENAEKLHQMAVSYVRAEAQAEAIKAVFDDLSPEHQALVRRARNRRSHSKPKHADAMTYKWSTAFEALIGYLYLSGETERMEDLIGKAIAITEENWK